MTERPIAYLAGPDVFFHNAHERGKRMVELCEAYGIVGLFPADDEIFAKIESMRDKSDSEIADAIFEADIAKIRECTCVIANLMPFRSPSADPGTTWEMGMAFGLGKPVWGYCSDTRLQDERIADMKWDKKTQIQFQNGSFWAPDGMMIDMFGGIDNLMMTRSIVNKSNIPISFEAALKQVADYYQTQEFKEKIQY